MGILDLGIGDWVAQFIVAFVGWFWPITGSVGIAYFLAVLLSSEKWSTRIFAAGVLLAILLFVQGLYFQISGYAMVNDLRVQFEAATAATDESGRSLVNINQFELVKMRNERLSKNGLCAYGAWWETKSSGEKPVAHTNWINYYYCGRYSN